MRMTDAENDIISALEARLATTAEVWRGRLGTYVSVESSKGVTGIGRDVREAASDLLAKLGLST